MCGRMGAVSFSRMRWRGLAKCDVSCGMETTARRRAIPVRIGPVTIGGDAPIVVQSMTNTDTVDVAGTVNQVMALAQAREIDAVLVTELSRSMTRARVQQYQRYFADAEVDIATIGGLISTNAGGVAVLRYGMMRDLVLGLGVVRHRVLHVGDRGLLRDAGDERERTPRWSPDGE